ncbi:MAG TPA: glycosyl transferase, partial [Propionibacteriaceae bacterium]
PGTQGAPGNATRGGAGDGMRGGMGGGLLGGATVSTEATTLLKTEADAYTWVAAASGSQTAASYQLATGSPVMAIGGFNGSDPSPTLDEFKALVAANKIHYYIGGAQGGRGMQQNGGSNAAAEISAWVTENFTATTVGSSILYDLTATA